MWGGGGGTRLYFFCDHSGKANLKEKKGKKGYIRCFFTQVMSNSRHIHRLGHTIRIERGQNMHCEPSLFTIPTGSVLGVRSITVPILPLRY